MLLKLYLHNYTEKLKISVHHPLDADLAQVMEIFSYLPQHDGSYFGLIYNEEIMAQFSKYNKFVWLIEIPIPKKKGSYQMFLSEHKCKNIISELFDGLNPLKINGLVFEKDNY